jgi:hypothetical protein
MASTRAGGGGAGERVSLRVPAKRRRHAEPALPLRHGHSILRAGVLAAADLAPRRSVAARRHPGPRPAHGDEPPAHHRPDAGATFHQLPPGAQPRRLVPPRRRPLAAGLADRRLRPDRDGGAGRSWSRFRPRSGWNASAGLDDTIERRRGKRIAAQGIYRDPVRSSHGHFVKASGLRWLSLMLLVPIPWAGRVWAELVKVPAAQRLEYQRRGSRC